MRNLTEIGRHFRDWEKFDLHRQPKRVIIWVCRGLCYIQPLCEEAGRRMQHEGDTLQVQEIQKSTNHSNSLETRNAETGTSRNKGTRNITTMIPRKQKEVYTIHRAPGDTSETND